jgi:hypothetical protein
VIRSFYTTRTLAISFIMFRPSFASWPYEYGLHPSILFLQMNCNGVLQSAFYVLQVICFFQAFQPALRVGFSYLQYVLHTREYVKNFTEPINTGAIL